MLVSCVVATAATLRSCSRLVVFVRALNVGWNVLGVCFPSASETDTSETLQPNHRSDETIAASTTHRLAGMYQSYCEKVIP